LISELVHRQLVNNKLKKVRFWNCTILVGSSSLVGYKIDIRSEINFDSEVVKMRMRFVDSYFVACNHLNILDQKHKLF